MLTLNLSRPAQPVNLTVTGTERDAPAGISPTVAGKEEVTAGLQVPLEETVRPSTRAAVAVRGQVTSGAACQVSFPA